jgi:hypothetical protein
MDRQPAQKFQDLVVWQKSHQLTLRVYGLTATCPKHELYGLTSQMRYYFILSRDLGYLAITERFDDADEVARVLGAYCQTLLSPAS